MPAFFHPLRHSHPRILFFCPVVRYSLRLPHLNEKVNSSLRLDLMPWDCFPDGQTKDSPAGDVEETQKIVKPDSGTDDLSQLNSLFDKQKNVHNPFLVSLKGR